MEVLMNRALRWKIVAPAAVLSLGLAAPVCAQSDNGKTAGESMHSAGESLEQAGSDTGHAAVHAYHSTATAMRDSKITLKVKAALHQDKLTRHSDIHVSTSAGVVKLTGEVASNNAAARAEDVAKGTEGVKDVDNQLKVSSAAASD